MIRRVRLHTAVVPMAAAFDHATRSRRSAASLLVEIELAGTRGWGEGAPRDYVTGETLDGAVRAVQACDPEELAERIEWRDFESAVASIAQLPLTGLVDGSSAAAAVEIALLDAVCRHFARPLADVLRVLAPPARSRRDGPTSVSLVIHLSRDVATVLDALTPRALAALRHVKIKVADPAGAVDRLTAAQDRLPADTRVSLDVNGAWTAEEAEKVAGELDGVGWVEEPLPPRSWPELGRLRRATGLPVMLDESCTGPADLHAAATSGAASHINVRLSKCGGFLAAARLALRADELGVGCQLGVHVAEVGPLWAAGRTLATAWDLWQTVEAGRADEWFPVPLTTPAFTVDRSLHRVEPLTGPGTGIEPTEELLRHTRCAATWESGGGWRRNT
ncbi:dipeptide epimerase [Streptomyces sp. CRB46]|uniref:dipeptide epimerase n=1 Tax=Streptomyces sp. CRB46 TaxID=2682613 RepID=UPI0018F593C1|nr:dipeptide epimerase [Streptomyces sp. CRB46]